LADLRGVPQQAAIASLALNLAHQQRTIRKDTLQEFYSVIFGRPCLAAIKG
jgi:hypothetical protein